LVELNSAHRTTDNGAAAVIVQMRKTTDIVETNRNLL